MHFSTVLAGALLAAAPALVAAQQPPQVFVGMNGTLTFNPSSLTVSPGGTVEFIFMSKNHSVYQSTFTDPCNPMAGGFQAQYFPVAADVTDFPSVTLQVNQSTPIWFYCPQTNPANHCKAGMVGAINPTADKTIEMFQAMAMGQTAATNTTGTTDTNSTTAATGASGANTAAGAGATLSPAGGAAGAAGNGTGAAGNGTAAGGNGAPSLNGASSGLTVALALIAGSVFAL